MKWIFLLLLACVAVNAQVISDYPFFYVHDGLFDASYVIGDESDPVDVVTATILSTNLARFDDIRTAVGTTMMDTEVSDIRAINAIVVGNPCTSSAAAALEGNPVDCYEGLEGSTGYIKLFRHGNKVQLLITGITPEDRQAVAKLLAEEDLNHVNATFYSLRTGTGSRLPAVESVSVPVRDDVQEYEADKTEMPPAPVKAEVKQVRKYEPLEVSSPERRGFFARLFAAIARFFRSLFG